MISETASTGSSTIPYKDQDTHEMRATDNKREDENMFTCGKKKNVKGAFKQSRKNELLGLLKEGTFEVMPSDSIPEDERVFNYRFFDEIKNAGEGLRK